MTESLSTCNIALSFSFIHTHYYTRCQLKAGGVDLAGLVRHYTMVTEFQWQFIETDDLAQSITVLDLDGIKMMDFVGEWYVKQYRKST